MTYRLCPVALPKDTSIARKVSMIIQALSKNKIQSENCGSRTCCSDIGCVLQKGGIYAWRRTRTGAK